jgi:hypothetical protein
MPGLATFFTGFNDLTTCRALGFGVGPIPWRDMDWYADRLGLDGMDRSEFLYLIRAMDNAYLEHTQEEQAKRLKDTPIASGGKPIGAQ